MADTEQTHHVEDEAATTSPPSEKASLSGSDVVADEKASSALEANEAGGEAAYPAQDPMTIRPIHGAKWFIAMLSVYLTAFLYGLDTTIAADVQPAIVESLGGLTRIAWVGIGFPLGSVAVILSVGFAYSLFQIKLLFIGSVILFEAGSALCGGAPNMNALIVGRVIAGAGGAGMYLGVLNYIGVFTTYREAAMYNALCGLVWGFGTVLGPVVGGAFASSSATWRWAFYINLCLAAVCAPAFLFLLPANQPRKDITFVQKLKELDWLGTILNAGMFVTFVLALNFAGTTWSWDDHRFIAMIVVFGVLLILFIVTQYFSVLTTPERRIFPGQFLRSRSQILLYICTGAASSSLFIPAYYIPLFFQFVRDDSAIKAAVRLLPFIVLAVATCLLNGGLMPQFGYYMPWYLASGVFILIGAALMTTINAGSAAASVYGFTILIGIGVGLSCQAGYSVATSLAKPQEIPAAVGFQNLAQVGTIVIALTISGNVFQNFAYKHLQTALANSNFTQQQIKGALAGTQSYVFQHGTEAQKQAAIDAIVKAMHNVWFLPIAAGALIFVASLCMKREKLFGK